MIESSVDYEDLTRYETGRLAEQKHGGIGAVSDVPHTPQWTRLLVPAFVLAAFSREPVHAFRTRDRSRGNDIGSNPVRALFDGKNSGGSVNGCFGGGDMYLVWRSFTIAAVLLTNKLAIRLKQEWS